MMQFLILANISAAEYFLPAKCFQYDLWANLMPFDDLKLNRLTWIHKFWKCYNIKFHTHMGLNQNSRVFENGAQLENEMKDTLAKWLTWHIIHIKIYCDLWNLWMFEEKIWWCWCFIISFTLKYVLVLYWDMFFYRVYSQICFIFLYWDMFFYWFYSQYVFLFSVTRRSRSDESHLLTYWVTNWVTER